MANLPQKLPLDLMQTKWASQINPILSNPIINGLQLTSIKLINGSNSVNHLLGRNLQGYFITNKNDFADIYDTQSTNQTPDLTLNLFSSANVTVSLWVY